MPPQPSPGRPPGASTPRPRADGRRSWLSHGLAALAISALGLGVAAAVPLTTHAETPQPTPGYDDQVISAPATAKADGATGVFVPIQSPQGGDTDELVRAAVVKERAAQRAEQLSKAAEEASRATRAAAREMRAKSLATTDRQLRETAVKIAAERRQRAIAARVAAEFARKRAQEAAAAAATAAEAAASAANTSTETGTTTPTPNVDAQPGSGVNTLPSSSNGFSPVPGAVIGTPFGATGLWARYHTGLDFRAAEGTPIRAVQGGVVVYAGNSGNWSGNHVAIMHAGGITTMSSHMSSIAVHVGQTVRGGQVIGRVGHTGRAFGAHLHFEVYPRGVRYGDIYHAINPVPWLRSLGVHTR